MELIDNENEKEKRLDDGYKNTNLRKTCLNLLMRIKPAQNGQKQISPIKIKGDDQITYSMIREFMMMKQNYTYIDKNVA